MRTTLIILGLIAVAACILLSLRSRPDEAVVWQELSARIPAEPLAPADAQISENGLFANATPELDEFGHVQLANGEIWRFAFRSHHRAESSESFSIFTGPLGTFRVRGDYFCCEVQLPKEATAKDSAEFLAFLRRVNPSVEPVQIK